MHPAGLLTSEGVISARMLARMATMGLRRYEPAGTMSESRFREMWFEVYADTRNALKRKNPLRHKASELILSMMAKCFAGVEEAWQEVTARNYAVHEERSRTSRCDAYSGAFDKSTPLWPLRHCGRA